MSIEIEIRNRLEEIAGGIKKVKDLTENILDPNVGIFAIGKKFDPLREQILDAIQTFSLVIICLVAFLVITNLIVIYMSVRTYREFRSSNHKTKL